METWQLKLTNSQNNTTSLLYTLVQIFCSSFLSDAHPHNFQIQIVVLLPNHNGQLRVIKRETLALASFIEICDCSSIFQNVIIFNRYHLKTCLNNCRFHNSNDIFCAFYLREIVSHFLLVSSDLDEFLSIYD